MKGRPIKSSDRVPILGPDLGFRRLDANAGPAGLQYWLFWAGNDGGRLFACGFARRRVRRSWQRSADFASWAFSILTRPVRIEVLDPGVARCRTWESGQ